MHTKKKYSNGQSRGGTPGSATLTNFGSSNSRRKHAKAYVKRGAK